jgi:hypothetical protein
MQALATLMALSAVVAACGAEATSGSAAPATDAPAPVVTPDPHLTEPATAEQVFNAIRRGDLPQLSITNAIAGGPNDALIRRFNAQVANWPLTISEYRSSAALREQLAWDPAPGPRQGEAPYTWVGLNIVVAFGPVTGRPTAPDDARQQQAEDIVALIDPLLWPLEQRSVTPIPTKTGGSTAASPAPAAPASAPPASAQP